MKPIFIFFVMISLISRLDAQVGINTNDPTSELEIETTNTGIPALEINPQTAPVGSAEGQLSVIDGELCMYDVARAKWLSIDSTPLQFGADSSNGEYLLFPGYSFSDTYGALMPHDGTIVAVTVATDKTGNASSLTKRFRFMVNGANVPNNPDPTLSGRFNLVSGEYTRTDFNIDFDAGDDLTIRTLNAGGRVYNVLAVIWVKWRK